MAIIRKIWLPFAATLVLLAQNLAAQDVSSLMSKGEYAKAKAKLVEKRTTLLNNRYDKKSPEVVKLDGEIARAASLATLSANAQSAEQQAREAFEDYKKMTASESGDILERYWNFGSLQSYYELANGKYSAALSAYSSIKSKNPSDKKAAERITTIKKDILPQLLTPAEMAKNALYANPSVERAQNYCSMLKISPAEAAKIKDEARRLLSARQSGTNGLKSYLDNPANVFFRTEASREYSAMLDSQRWESIDKQSMDDLRLYINEPTDYTKLHIDQAKASLVELNEKIKAKNTEAAVWAKADKSSEQALLNYLSKHPKTAFFDELSALADGFVWEKVDTNSAAALKAYIANSTPYKQVNAGLAVDCLNRRNDEQAWKETDKRNTSSLYAYYNSKKPIKSHETQARALAMVLTNNSELLEQAKEILEAKSLVEEYAQSNPAISQKLSAAEQTLAYDVFNKHRTLKNATDFYVKYPTSSNGIAAKAFVNNYEKNMQKANKLMKQYGRTKTYEEFVTEREYATFGDYQYYIMGLE